jgi:hypothetical protein
VPTPRSRTCCAAGQEQPRGEGRLAGATGGNDVLTMRLVPSEQGSTVATRHGTLHLSGFKLELTPAARG